MPWTKKHLKWLTDTGTHITTADGKTAAVWEFNYQTDEVTLSAWAKHFRNHYCPDTDIDDLKPSKQSRKDYLTDMKFPNKTSTLGPAIRAGDFGEILVADYLEYVLKFWVPRVRWNSKVVRDESTKGSDVIGFKFHQSSRNPSHKDILFIFEAKTKFSKSSENRLQEAINHSAKDYLRIGESLNFIKQKYVNNGDNAEAKGIGRFQNPTDIPYKQTFGAAALISDECYDVSELSMANCSKIPQSKKAKNTFYAPHPYKDDLVLLIIKGPDMMDLVHKLYRRAADEA
ncbi:Hachiman antiphage defense system protein HamA [Desulfovibrio litoralis]|uniref:Anti-bacteriophage protein A/HamA C-terminal domain-containing protein n=1 Tax=Desulfovibrio litoralis DSM 11393 TaxID=1121455 RepID=A0A1M7SZI2_9BACT|nr:Hachiman antiphage defense system protein HamA [Desulfovibrio litoralis]SHN63841.1 protein of unknown function [Desulfovibrio litoralis DSM 11393]